MLEELIVAIQVNAQDVEEKLERIIMTLQTIAIEAKSAEQAMRDMDAQIKKATGAEMSKGIEEMQTAIDEATQRCKELKEELELKKTLTENINRWKSMKSEIAKTEKTSDKYGETIAEIRETLRLSEEQGKQFYETLDRQADYANADLARTQSEATAAQSELGRLVAMAMQSYGVDVDTSAAIAALKALNLTAEQTQALLALLGGEKGGSTHSNSGGKSKKEREAEEAKRAAQEAKRAQEEAYREQLEIVEHKRKLNETTLKEEIAALERIKTQYARTAEQIRDIDERIYAARQELRENEEAQIDKLHESVKDALEARYEEQRKAEQARIEDSIAAWEKWSDETCEAIQAQIDALDEKAKAEDREEKAAEKTRKIDALHQQMAYETDEYNLRQLQKQLDKAEADWAQTHKDWEREDQKEALRAQMEAARAQAEVEIGNLEAERARIDAYYDEMTNGTRLEEEARRIMMQRSQEEILHLIGQYAPDYEATGKTLGEKFYEGFKDVMGNITSWFERFNTQMEEIQDNMAQRLMQARGSAQSAETAQTGVPAQVTQTVNFNVPVESPNDTRRRMEEANAALAAMI